MKQESNQAEAVEKQVSEQTTEETPKESPEPTSETTSTEEKATSERVRTEEEFRKLQSRMTRAINDAKSYEKNLQTVQSQLQELRKKEEQRELEARQRELSALEGEPEEQAKVRRKHQLEDEVRRLEQKRTDEEGAVGRKYDQALNLAKEHNLSLEDARELLDATSPREMELLAQLKARNMKEEQAKTATSEKSGYKPDSGTSDAGGEDDKAFMKRYSEGKSNDHARAQKILAKTSNEKLV
ncbi:MAG: hypothetical protein ACFFCO_11950 [Promethearchaeota archaeon]